MGSFFSLEGPFYKVGEVIADIMLVGILWLLCCLPIVTIGASTTSAFYVMTKKVSKRGSYVTREFFASFKTNFVKATKLWLILLLAVGIVVWGIYVNLVNAEIMGDMGTIILPIQMVVCAELAMVTFFAFPMLSRFDMKTKEILKTSFFMANKHFFASISAIILAALLVFITLEAFPPLILIDGGIFAYITSFTFVKIFRKYKPELDRDPLELEQVLLEISEQAEKKAAKKTARAKKG